MPARNGQDRPYGPGRAAVSPTQGVPLVPLVSQAPVAPPCSMAHHQDVARAISAGNATKAKFCAATRLVKACH